jgi:hypothetical protein
MNDQIPKKIYPRAIGSVELPKSTQDHHNTDLGAQLHEAFLGTIKKVERTLNMSAQCEESD